MPVKFTDKSTLSAIPVWFPGRLPCCSRPALSLSHYRSHRDIVLQSVRHRKAELHAANAWRRDSLPARSVFVRPGPAVGNPPPYC